MMGNFFEHRTYAVTLIHVSFLLLLYVCFQDTCTHVARWVKELSVMIHVGVATAASQPPVQVINHVCNRLAR